MTCKNNLEFNILNNNGERITITCNLGDDNKLYRCGKPIYCNCTSKPTPYLFDGDIVYCPSCGKKSLEVKQYDNLMDNIHLTYFGTDLNTMQDLYKLSDTLPYTIWSIVSDYFMKLKPNDVDLGFPVNYVGWVTSNPEKVEELLGVHEEQYVCNRDIQKDLEDIKKNYAIDIVEDSILNIEIADIVDKLHAVFSVVETPYGEFQLYDDSNNEDYIVENPLFPLNPSIGNGECWYVKKSNGEIWYIRYNYRDGDDLRMNNVLIDFELKAIGKVIPYDEDVEELLNKLRTIKD